MTGFKPLKTGKIHLLCPKCGRKMSNAVRADGDPEPAMVAKVLCPRCCDVTGALEPVTTYLDLNGDDLPWEAP